MQTDYPTVTRAGYKTAGVFVSVECMSDHEKEWYRERFVIFRLLGYYPGGGFLLSFFCFR